MQGDTEQRKTCLQCYSANLQCESYSEGVNKTAVVGNNKAEGNIARSRNYRSLSHLSELVQTLDPTTVLAGQVPRDRGAEILAVY